MKNMIYNETVRKLIHGSKLHLCDFSYNHSSMFFIKNCKFINLFENMFYHLRLAY